MNNAKMLERVYAIVNTLEESDKKFIEKVSIQGGKFIADTMPVILGQLIHDLKEDIYADEAKKTGKSAALRVARKMLKNGGKVREALGYAPIIDGKQYICDSFSIVELNNPLPLPELPTHLEYIDAKRILQKPNGAIDIELPDAAKLRAYIKINKADFTKQDAKGNIFYDFGDPLPVVDALFLLNMLELLPDATAAVTPREKSNLNGIYFEGESGRGMLLPIRPKDGTERKKTEV
jgi:hypothetical protein